MKASDPKSTNKLGPNHASKRTGKFAGKLKRTAQHFQASDMRAIAQLATQATAGVTRIVEGVHQSVWDQLGMPGSKPTAKGEGAARGLTGLAYKSVQGVNRLVGKGLESLLKRLEPSLAGVTAGQEDTPQRAALVAVLNGVMGDHLQASANPLATPMTMRWQGQMIDWQALPVDFAPTGRVLLLIHGLCMNDLQWSTPQHAQQLSYDQALAETLGYTPIYLRYNSGLHTSTNGRQLAAQLEELVQHWPVEIETLSIVAHSMGGLLMRSACQIAAEQGLAWLPALKHIVFLGTPHHGAPLERAGNWIDVLLGSTPFTAPLAKLGQLRSAGITDLRHGHVRDEDWMGDNRFHRRPDQRLITPLPAGVKCYAVAATLAPKRSTLANRLIGDGLVPLHSALGEHDDPRRDLGFSKTEQKIFYRMNHMELLASPLVRQQLKAWLGPAQDPSNSISS